MTQKLYLPLRWRDELTVGDTLQIEFEEGPNSETNLDEKTIKSVKRDTVRGAEDRLLVTFEVD